ncbi:MAG: hypothetical protein HFJ54_03900 [Clostridia bacterium]|nr:hypothetical protein [Clostridia bacterium]
MEKIKGEEQKKIRKFFAGVFIDKERLEENNISYPIKLEYYKIRDSKDEYGIEVVKTEYREEFTKIENEVVTKITTEEEKINSIIHKLKRNIVTPTGLKDTLEEILF